MSWHFGMPELFFKYLEIIPDGIRIIVFDYDEVNSEGQNSRDTSTGNLSEKFTGSGLDAILFSNSCTFRKLRNDAHRVCELAIVRARLHVLEDVFIREIYELRRISEVCLVMY